jgi:peptidoglycan LD-endopeptidase CwlK
MGVDGEIPATAVEAPKSPVVDSSMTLEQTFSFPQESPPPPEILSRQRIADVYYVSFDGEIHKGQVVVDADLVGDVQGGFEVMRKSGFPISSAVPMGIIPSLPEADRPKAWRNSIGFNFRQSVGGKKLSNHSLGRAIDINPQLNPYIKGDLVVPPNSTYDTSQPGTITADSEIVAYFKSKGWVWGGDFEGRKDFMHFEKGVPQAIFILGGGNRVIEKEGRSTRYTTSPYKGRFFFDEKNPRTGGAKARPIAALELAQDLPGAKIVTLSQRPGHLTQGTIPSPDFAEVLADDLVRHGIDRERIMQQSASTSTLTEMMEVIKISAENDWTSINVVVSDYQVERADILLGILTDPIKYADLKHQLLSLFLNSAEMEIFEQKMAELENAIDRFKASSISVNFVSAEDTLLGRSKHHANLVNYVRSLEGYANVQRQEIAANEKIRAGEYNFAQETFRQYILSLH